MREWSLLDVGTSSTDVARHFLTCSSYKLSTEHCEVNEFASFLSAYSLNFCADKFSSIQNLSIRYLLFVSIGPDPREDACVWDPGPTSGV